MSTRITARAPTRIDLAGGTLDLWPLYLFVKEPVTLNLGIDLYAEARLEVSKTVSGNPTIELESQDQNLKTRLTWQDLISQNPVPALELHWKLLRYFAQSLASTEVNLKLSTSAQSPAGAGLGGSSALSIAILGALTSRTLKRNQVPSQQLIEIARDIETTVIQVPAGIQDYYGAMFGGLQSLHWGVSSHHREEFPEEVRSETAKRILLFYSGQSRNSGINNWALFKDFIDRKNKVREKFEKIGEATRKLISALKAQDWDSAALAIAEEWTTRKTLAPGITTPEMDRAFSQAAEMGATAGKVCGAGGGGCFFLFVSDSSKAEKVRSALTQSGLRHLPFRPDAEGLRITS